MNDTLNGEVKSPQVNQPLVRLLENALAGVKAGKFVAGGLVLGVNDGNWIHFANHGGMFMQLISGCSVLEHDLIVAMKQTQQQQGRRILRAGPGQVMPRG